MTESEKPCSKSPVCPLAIITILLTFAILASGYWYYQIKIKDICQKQYDELADTGKLKSKQIELWLDDKLRDISLFSREISLTEKLGKLEEDSNSLGFLRQLQEYLELKLAEDKHITNAMFINKNGEIILSAIDNAGSICPITKNTIDIVLTQNKAVFVELHPCPTHKTIEFIFVAPIPPSNGNPSSQLILLVTDAESFFYSFAQFRPSSSNSFETMLVHRGDEDVLLLNLVGSPRSPVSFLPLTRKELPSVQAILGRSGKFQGKDHNGIEILADLRQIPNSSWFIINKMDMDEILAKPRYHLKIFFALTILCILLVAITAIVIYQHRLTKIYQDMYHSESEKVEAQEKFKTILYSIGDAVITTNEKAQIHHVNPVAENLIGWTEAELRGKLFNDIFKAINEETLLPIENPINLALKEGRICGIVNHTLLISRDGAKIPIADSSAPIRDASGTIIGAVLVFHDQSEERKKADELRKSEEQYRALFENSREAMMTLAAPSWHFMSCNPVIVKMFGIKNQDEFIAFTPWELSPEFQPDGRLSVDKAREMIEIAVRDGENFFEWTHKRVTGETFACTVLLTRIKISKEFILHATIHDISMQKHTEMELCASELRYQTLFEKNVDGILIADIETRQFRYSNPALCKMLGYSEAELKTMSVADIHPKDNLESIIADFNAQSRKEKISAIDIPCLKKDGSIVYTDIYSTPLVFDGVMCLMGFFRDVTERKQAEAKNKEMSEQLQQAQKMEAIGRLAGGIAHDFNNQLMCIMGYAEILSEQLDDNMLKNDAEFIIEATKRAARLTSNLLAFSRKGKYLSEPTNVHKVIEDVFTILERTIDKKISLKKVLNANPDTINGDPTQIQNSLLNLAINARDALPSGGEIIFKTEIVNIEDIKDIFKNNDECDKMKKGDYLKISVADNGIGINDDTIKHIFEPFFTTKPIGKGTGMGLASVYGTTKSHNGLIKVDSKPGKGATFSLFFPLIDNESTFKKLAGTVDVTRTLKKEANILVVDDEEIIRILLSRTLSSLGYKVVTCKDGLEALEYYRHSWKDIDVVILDIIMPKMNGNEAFFKMQAINKEIKTIVISGFSIDGEAQDLLDAGVKGFIQKPFETNILSKMLTEILNKK